MVAGAANVEHGPGVGAGRAGEAPEEDVVIGQRERTALPKSRCVFRLKVAG
jgi:hypothetical protein